MHDINNFDTFSKIVPLTKGMSSDKKYYIENIDGKHLLLRIAEISEYDRKKTEFENVAFYNLCEKTIRKS